MELATIITTRRAHFRCAQKLTDARICKSQEHPDILHLNITNGTRSVNKEVL